MFERLGKFFSCILRGKMTEKCLVGKMGEDAAAKFLKRKSYKIKSRNFRSGHKEIDIVALDGDVLVFVEVKTRKDTAPVGGYWAAIARAKRARVRACATAYMKTLPHRPNTWRFDVVEVSYSQSTMRPTSINHYINVY